MLSLEVAVGLCFLQGNSSLREREGVGDTFSTMGHCYTLLRGLKHP